MGKPLYLYTNSHVLLYSIPCASCASYKGSLLHGMQRAINPGCSRRFWRFRTFQAVPGAASINSNIDDTQNLASHRFIWVAIGRSRFEVSLVPCETFCYSI